MPEELIATIAANVRALMAKRYITQTDIGLALGLSQGQVSERIRGKIEFKITELQKVADLLECPLEQLFKE